MTVIDFRSKKQIEPDKIFLSSAASLGVQDYYKSCCVCGWDKGGLELFFLGNINQQSGYYTYESIVPLCANHRHEMQQFNLKKNDLEKVQQFLWTINNFLAPF